MLKANMFTFSQGETVFVKNGFVLEVETLLLGEASQTPWSGTPSSGGVDVGPRLDPGT